MKITAVKINGMERPMGYAFSNVTVSWRVEVTGEDGEQAVSAPAPFDTGKMDEPWAAKWIGMREEDGFHPVFEKSFALKGTPVRARLYITGVGLYEASLNGVKIGDDVLAPFFNDYNTAIQVQTYDVTDMLTENSTLSVMLGNGWYKGRLGYEDGVALYGNRFGCIAELHVEYADGSKDVIATGESWQHYPSDIIYSDIYDGEGIDRTLNAGGVTKKQAILMDMSGKKLVDRYSMPLREMEELPVKEIIRTPAGETVLDFAGYVKFHAAFPEGTKVWHRRER